MPGVAKGDVHITLGDETVTLRSTIAKHNGKEGDYYFYRERRETEFVRTLHLPATVDGTNARATYANDLVQVIA